MEFFYTVVPQLTQMLCIKTFLNNALFFVADSDEAFGSFEKPCTEGNTSVAASSELSQLVQTASICSAGAKY